MVLDSSYIDISGSFIMLKKDLNEAHVLLHRLLQNCHFDT